MSGERINEQTKKFKELIADVERQMQNIVDLKQISQEIAQKSGHQQKLNTFTNDLKIQIEQIEDKIKEKKNIFEIEIEIETLARMMASKDFFDKLTPTNIGMSDEVWQSFLPLQQSIFNLRRFYLEQKTQNLEYAIERIEINFARKKSELLTLKRIELLESLRQIWGQKNTDSKASYLHRNDKARLHLQEIVKKIESFESGMYSLVQKDIKELRELFSIESFKSKGETYASLVEQNIITFCEAAEKAFQEYDLAAEEIEKQITAELEKEKAKIKEEMAQKKEEPEVTEDKKPSPPASIEENKYQEETQQEKHEEIRKPERALAVEEGTLYEKTEVKAQEAQIVKQTLRQQFDQNFSTGYGKTINEQDKDKDEHKDEDKIHEKDFVRQKAEILAKEIATAKGVLKIDSPTETSSYPVLKQYIQENKEKQGEEKLIRGLLGAMVVGQKDDAIAGATSAIVSQDNSFKADVKKKYDAEKALEELKQKIEVDKKLAQQSADALVLQEFEKIILTLTKDLGQKEKNALFEGWSHAGTNIVSKFVKWLVNDKAEANATSVTDIYQKLLARIQVAQIAQKNQTQTQGWSTSNQGYDLSLMSKDQLKEKVIEFACTTEGFNYRVIGFLSGKEETATIPWRELPGNFPRDKDAILNGKNTYLPQILALTSKKGYTPQKDTWERLTQSLQVAYEERLREELRIGVVFSENLTIDEKEDLLKKFSANNENLLTTNKSSVDQDIHALHDQLQANIHGFSDLKYKKDPEQQKSLVDDQGKTRLQAAKKELETIYRQGLGNLFANRLTKDKEDELQAEAVEHLKHALNEYFAELEKVIPDNKKEQFNKWKVEVATKLAELEKKDNLDKTLENIRALPALFSVEKLKSLGLEENNLLPLLEKTQVLRGNINALALEYQEERDVAREKHQQELRAAKLRREMMIASLKGEKEGEKDIYWNTLGPRLKEALSVIAKHGEKINSINEKYEKFYSSMREVLTLTDQRKVQENKDMHNQAMQELIQAKTAYSTVVTDITVKQKELLENLKALDLNDPATNQKILECEKEFRTLDAKLVQAQLDYNESYTRAKTQFAEPAFAARQVVATHKLSLEAEISRVQRKIDTNNSTIQENGDKIKQYESTMEAFNDAKNKLVAQILPLKSQVNEAKKAIETDFQNFIRQQPWVKKKLGLGENPSLENSQILDDIPNFEEKAKLGFFSRLFKRKETVKAIEARRLQRLNFVADLVTLNRDLGDIEQILKDDKTIIYQIVSKEHELKNKFKNIKDIREHLKGSAKIALPGKDGKIVQGQAHQFGALAKFDILKTTRTKFNQAVKEYQKKDRQAYNDAVNERKKLKEANEEMAKQNTQLDAQIKDTTAQVNKVESAIKDWPTTGLEFQKHFETGGNDFKVVAAKPAESSAATPSPFNETTKKEKDKVQEEEREGEGERRSDTESGGVTSHYIGMGH